MKAVIRQEWKAWRGELCTYLVVVLMFNLSAMMLRHLGSVDLLKESGHNNFILTWILTATAMFVTWLFPVWNVMHYETSLGKAFSRDTSSLLLTIPRSGAVIFGGRTLLYTVVTVLATLLTSICSYVQGVSVISVNSGKEFWEIARFGVREIMAPNLALFGCLSLFALVVLEFLFSVITLRRMLLMAFRGKWTVMAVGGAILLGSGIMVGAYRTGYLCLLIPLLLVLLLQLPFRHVFIRGVMGFFLIIAAFICLPVEIIGWVRDRLPLEMKVSGALPLTAIRDTFCPTSAKFIINWLKPLEEMVRSGSAAIPLDIPLVLLALAAVNFLIARWYFDRRLEA